MPIGVEGQMLVYPTFRCNLFQQNIRPAVPIEIEQAFSSAERFVTVYDFTCTLHQLHTEGDIRLLPYRWNPQAAVYSDKVVGSEVLDVDERYSRQASEDENIPDNRHCRVIETVRHERLHFFLR